MKLHLPKTLRAALAAVAAVALPVATTVAAGVLTFGSYAFADGEGPTFDSTFTTVVPDASDARLGEGKTVCFDIPAGGNSYLSEDGVIACDIVVNNAYFTNSYSGRIYNFTGTISGNGTWNYNPSGSGNKMTYQFYGDMSEYSGDMSVVDGRIARFYYFGHQVGKEGAAGTITANNGSSSVNLYGATLYSTAVQTSTLVVGVTENTTALDSKYTDDYSPTTTYGASTVYGAITAENLTIETDATLNVSAVAGSSTIASTATTLTNNGTLNVNEGTELTIANLTLGNGASITNTGTLNVTGTLSTTMAFVETGDSSIVYSEGNNGLRSGSATKKLFDGAGNVNVTADTIAINGTDYALTKDGNNVSVTVALPSDDHKYYVMDGEVVYGDSGNHATDSDVTGLVLGGGSLTMTQGLTDAAKAEGIVVNLNGSVIKLDGETVTLSGEHVHVGNGVTGTKLAGNGRYEVGTSMGGVALDSTWTGTVASTGTGNVVNGFNFSDCGNANSKIEVSNWKGYVANSTDALGSGELIMGAGDALTITNGYSNTYYTVKKISGEGNLVRAAGANTAYISLKVTESIESGLAPSRPYQVLAASAFALPAPATWR